MWHTHGVWGGGGALRGYDTDTPARCVCRSDGLELLQSAVANAALTGVRASDEWVYSLGRGREPT